MRHFFCDSLKRFFVALVATLAFVAPTFAATLPSDYTELEYIQSSGTQYIDTNFVPNNNTSVETRAQLYSESNVRFFAVYNASSSTPYYGVGFSGSKKWVNQTNTSNTVTNTSSDKNLHIVYKNKTALYVDGTQIDNSGSGNFTSNYSIYLLAANIAGTASFISSGKLYHTKIWDNDTLVRDFVPAKNSSGVVGMYDTVNDQFYTNAGTGTFTAGPVVLNPCRNLADMTTSNIDIGHYISSAGAYLESTSNFIYAPFISVQPNTTYTLSWGNIELYYVTISEYSTANNAGFVVRNTGTTGGNYKLTITTGATTHYVRFGSNPYGNSNTVTLTQIQELNWQFEEGSTATAYVPYCATDGAIKIATTKYTEDAFAGLITTLESAITKVTNIVDTTVQQATEIGVLSETKQDRPDTDCPAGRKCLLIMGADNKPHWYLIQE